MQNFSFKITNLQVLELAKLVFFPDSQAFRALAIEPWKKVDSNPGYQLLILHAGAKIHILSKNSHIENHTFHKNSPF